MFEIWKQWQEDAGLDSKIEKLLRMRKDEFITTLCLQWQVDRQYLELSKTRAALNKVVIKCHEIDGQLAKIDGRFSIVKMAEAEFKTDQSVKKLLKKMSKDERSSLIDELLKMK